MIGALRGGSFGGMVGGGACVVVLGFSTAGPGALICAVVGGTVGGKIAGDFGSERGEKVGDFLYREVSE